MDLLLRPTNVQETYHNKILVGIEISMDGKDILGRYADGVQPAMGLNKNLNFTALQALVFHGLDARGAQETIMGRRACCSSQQGNGASLHLPAKC